jgi:hypothetical protein
MEECTFMPDTMKAGVSTDEPFFKGGTKEFLHRQDKARLR